MRKGGGKPNKTPSLKEPSSKITTHLEMEATCALYNASDTLYLQKESNIDKGGLPVPFLIFSHLCHVSTLMKEAIDLLVKTPKNFYGKEKHIHWVTVTIKPFLQQSCQCCSHPTSKTCR
jgi:hypothetical protein